MKHEEYFMDIAKAIAAKSKDPRTKVGSILVDSDNRIVSTGYNGMPYRCKEDELWSDKYPFVIHAEMNAILYAKRDLRGCQMYTTLAPCINCLKHSLQAGIRVITYDNYRHDRFEKKEKEDIRTLIRSTNCLIKDMKGNNFYEELKK